MNTYFRTISAVGLLVAAVALFPQSAFAAKIQASTISNSTTEAGDSATFTITLDEPIVGMTDSEVTIPVSSNNTSEGTTAVTEVLFTGDNWFVPQTVTVQGVDEDIDDGDVAYSVVLGAAVSDSEYYNGFNAADVSVVNVDNDTTGVSVVPTSTTVVEGEPGEDLAVALTSEPTDDVIVNVTSEGCEVFSNASLHFAPENWNVAQHIPLVMEDNSDFQGDVSCTLAYSVSADDITYAALTMEDLVITLQDDEILLITSVKKNLNTYTTSYSDGTEFTFEAFPGSNYTRWAVSSNGKALVISNGKYIRVFMQGVLTDEEQTNVYPKRREHFRLKVTKLDEDSTHDTVTLLRTNSKQTLKLTVMDLTSEYLLENKSEASVLYTSRNYLHLAVDVVTNTIDAKVGEVSDYLEYVWSVTESGSVLQQQ